MEELVQRTLGFWRAGIRPISRNEFLVREEVHGIPYYRVPWRSPCPLTLLRQVDYRCGTASFLTRLLIYPAASNPPPSPWRGSPRDSGAVCRRRRLLCRREQTPRGGRLWRYRGLPGRSPQPRQTSGTSG